MDKTHIHFFQWWEAIEVYVWVCWGSKLNYFSFDTPLSVTDLPLCYLTVMIDTAEPSSDFKHTNGTKRYFMPALVIYWQAWIVHSKHSLVHPLFSLAASHLFGVWTTTFRFYDPENIVNKWHDLPFIEGSPGMKSFVRASPVMLDLMWYQNGHVQCLAAEDHLQRWSGTDHWLTDSGAWLFTTLLWKSSPPRKGVSGREAPSEASGRF